MSSISIVYRKDKLNKKGEAPIHFRIIKDRKISYIASGLIIPKENWDFEKNKIKGKHTNCARLNSFLTNKFAEIQDQVFEHETISKSLTSRLIRNQVYGKKPTDFFPFADEATKIYLKDGKIGTYDKNLSIIAKLKRYAAGRNLAFQDITPDFLTKYDKHLKEVDNNTTNTVNKDFKYIRKLFNDAIRQDFIEYQVNPFLKYQMKTEKTVRVYLTEEELKKFMDYQVTPGTRMELHKDMFVFAAYTAGLRVSDMLKIQWKNFDGANINLTIHKTTNQLSIKVPTKGLDLINKYAPAEPKPNAFIFPMLPADLNLKNARELDNAISSATAYINKNLNDISKKAEIGKHLSFHISRHTWATRALTKGMSIEKVAKLLGHSGLREVQIYAKIIGAELDKAMDVFND